MKISKKALYSFLVLIVGCANQLQCWSASTLNQALQTTVPAAVNVTPVGGDPIIGSIDPLTGANSGVQGRFTLQSNGLDSSYDYVLQSSLRVQSAADVNAYGVSGGGIQYIILGSNATVLYPTVAAVNNIKSSPTSGGNPNAIAYPITTSVSSPSTINFVNDATYGGYCFKITMGSAQSVALSQTVAAAPIANTYLYTEDRPGVYQAVLTLSAFRKP